MWRSLFRWLVPLVVALTCWLGSSRAQVEVPRGANQMGGGEPTSTESSGHNPAPAYVFAVLATLLVLTIVCMPSRKA
jgi:hypothetical protein